ncbi:hypothetical protein CRV24_007236 [Beauveria bassiana]|nr:hypothetical protein CRV24_007236 [Beauveria bassiana]
MAPTNVPFRAMFNLFFLPSRFVAYYTNSSRDVRHYRRCRLGRSFRNVLTKRATRGSKSLTAPSKHPIFSGLLLLIGPRQWIALAHCVVPHLKKASTSLALHRQRGKQGTWGWLFACFAARA